MPDTKAKSFITIMIVIALTSLLLRVAIKQVIQASISGNEASASATLKLISAALENYAKNNQGLFPSSISILTKENPAYLDKDYTAYPSIKGYTYSCSRLEPSGYSCSSAPVSCQLSGETVYTITTGGVFITEPCDKKD